MALYELLRREETASLMPGAAADGREMWAPTVGVILGLTSRSVPSLTVMLEMNVELEV